MIETFKDKLRAGQSVTVINPDHPSPSLVEFMGRLPIDGVFIDCEQGSPDVETVENMARAARLVGLTSLVRVFSPDDWVIERYLLRGVDGIVAPRIDTAAQAKQVVAAVRYCLPRQHQEKLVVVQIESRSAVDGLADFLGVDGIDVYFIGPVDLAKSLGYEDDFRRPEVQHAIDAAIAAIRGAGKVAGILVERGDVAGYRNQGVQFFYAHANGFLAHGADDFARVLAGG
jgi:2-keto-3-deoxy-L-rhamnonate aldolase RhmA